VRRGLYLDSSPAGAKNLTAIVCFHF